MRMASVRALIGRVLYPQNAGCIACGRLRVDRAAWGLCEDCSTRLVRYAGPFCPCCGASGWQLECPECAMHPPDAIDARMAAFPYEGVAGKLVQALKYNAVLFAAAALSEGMAAVMPPEPFDAMIPVPLHRKRQRQRGFNQSDALCQALTARVGVPVCGALSRTRATRTQTQLSVEGRAQNVAGAFVVTQPVEGKALLLIDDVLTTGATGKACAQVLKEAGARRVVLLAATRAETS